MRRKTWKIKKLDSRIQTLAQKYKVSPILIQVFLNRNLNEEEFNSFLNPDLKFLHPADLLPDIKKAKIRVDQAISQKEKVLVFGDYDVDGITSLAIFNEFAKDFSNIFSFYIPHRVKEGYGLNEQAMLKAKKDKIKLIIAFDCGTNAAREIELAASLGIDVIVVDHHLPGQNKARPLAFINPKACSSSYPFLDLSSGALAFKFLQVLKSNPCQEALDLVALSLVCDVSPLRGENRILLKAGLKVIKTSSRPAIKALCRASRIKQENIDTFHLGFILGPRINASGRVACPQESLEIFLTQDQKTADDLSLKLGEYNNLRKEIGARILKEAEDIVQGNADSSKAIVVSGKAWHQGVLGIVASRLADKYYRPSFVISFDSGVGKGSGRSIHSIHLMEALSGCADSLIVYGGHKKAAGLHIEEDNLETFKTKINSFIESNSSPEDFLPVLDVDAVLRFSDIDLRLAEELAKLKPYGEANPEAIFISRNVFKKSPIKKIGSRYSVWLSDGLRTYEAIVANKDILEIMDYSQRFDIAFCLEVNSYYNIPKIKIKDCRIS